MFSASLCKDKRNGLSFCQIMKICFAVWLKWMLAIFHYLYNMYKKQETDVSSHALSRSEKSVFFQGFGAFSESIPVIMHIMPQEARGRNRSESCRLLCGSIWTISSPNRFYFTNLQVAERSCGSLQPPWKFIPRSKEWGERKAKKPQHYVVKPQGPEWAERAGKSSLALLSSSEINPLWRCALSRPPGECLKGHGCKKNCTENYFGRFQVTLLNQQSRPRWWCSGTWWHFGTPAQLNNQLEKQNAFLGFNSSAEPSVCHTENWEVFRTVKQCMALTIHCSSVLPLRGTKCSFPEKNYQFLQITRTLSKKKKKNLQHLAPSAISIPLFLSLRILTAFQQLSLFNDGIYIFLQSVRDKEHFGGQIWGNP